MILNSNVLLFFSISLWSFAASALTAEEILKNTDNIRNPSSSFVMNVKVQTPERDSEFLVYTKGNEKTLIKTMVPTKDKGRNMLMLGTDMWLYLPNLNNAVRVALSQRLTGEVSNGDLSRMRWYKDYNVTLVKEDSEKWLLHLTESRKGLTYSQINVYVEKKTYRPLTAEYMGPSGKKLKLATFDQYKKLAGEVRPSRITIQDAVETKKKSVLEIQTMEVKELPDSLFTKERLRD